MTEWGKPAHRLLPLSGTHQYRGQHRGDKAYTATNNFNAVDAVGAVLYAAFKRNTTGGVGGISAEMVNRFSANREEYLPHYHKRSKVESTFSAVKRKFGDGARQAEHGAEE